MPPVRRRKNLFIDQRRIDRAKALLRAETETETIDHALALVEDRRLSGRALLIGGPQPYSRAHVWTRG